MRIVTMIVAAAVGVLASAAMAQRSTPVQVTHPAGGASDQFGCSVAIDGDTMIVGAERDDVGVFSDQGSAHVYRWTGSGWAYEATLLATGGSQLDFFGAAVAVSGDTAVVGARLDTVGGNFGQGSAYVFTRTGTTWTQQAQLNGAGGAANDGFGTSVAISGDTVVVGALGDDVGAIGDQGSAYVFARTGTTWTQQAQLNAPGGAASDQFGNSVGISGDMVIVGAYADDVGANANQGSAWIFTRTGSAWTQQAQLTASDGAAGDLFGCAVAISGDTAVVGARDDVVAGNFGQGSAYVFTRSDGSWTQQAQLLAAGGAFGDAFGASVAVSGGTAIIGAWTDDWGSGTDQGAAFVFTRTGSTWNQQAHLTAADGSALDRFGASVGISGDLAVVGASYDDVGALGDAGSAWAFSRVGSQWIGPDLTMVASSGFALDGLGYSLAVSGDTVIAGAPYDTVTFSNQGSVTIFTRTGPTWAQQATLTISGGAQSDYFGVSVAISGDTAVVGAPYYDVGANSDQGSAHVFTRSGVTWTLQAQLSPIGAAAGDFFGTSVAISGDTIIVGAPGDDVGANGNQGSAYVFTRSGATWTQQAQLNATGGASTDSFGKAVALSGDTAVVGAPYDDVGANSDQGSAYVFTRSGAAWTQQAQLNATGGASNDFFGTALAVSGDTVLVGVPYDDVGLNVDQGSAYVFTRTGTTWTQQAQLNASGGLANDFFGASVALSGDTAAVGAVRADADAAVDAGAVFLFQRMDGVWMQRGRLTATDAGLSDQLGSSVGISGTTVLGGAYYDDVGTRADQGSVRAFEAPLEDLPAVRNNVTATTFASLAAALLPAAGGQQLTATEGAWRGAGSLNTFGRSLGLFGSGDVRIPSSSVVDVGGASAVSAASGSVVDIFGQLRASGYVNVDGDAFRLGSRGILTARTASSLSINAPTATVDGQVRVEQGASLTASGDWTNIGPVSMMQDAAFTATGLLRNIDTWTMAAGARAAAGTQIDNRSTWTVTAGELQVPLFNNLGAFNVFGTSAIFGRLTNNAGATATIRSGSLFVFGDLVNNGTVIGTICSACSGLPPSMDVGGTLSLGPSANLTMPFAGSVVRVGGSFECRIDSNARFDMARSTLQLESERPEVTLEVMSRDIGTDAAGLDRTIQGHFPIGELHIGGFPTTVRLVDASDNARDGFDACEALYVDTLRIDAGSRLINERCRIYYNTLVNDGVVDVRDNLISLRGTPCPADFNQDGGVDGGDVDAFFTAWESGDSAADVNLDGGVDGSDVDAFFTAWEAGGC